MDSNKDNSEILRLVKSIRVGDEKTINRNFDIAMTAVLARKIEEHKQELAKNIFRKNDD